MNLLRKTSVLSELIVQMISILCSRIILFPNKVNLENGGNLYSVYSNLTNIVLVIVLGMIIGMDA